MTDHRRALLSAALGFLQLRVQPTEVAMLHRWLDSWAGMGDVIAGLTRQGWDVELREGQDGWRANLYPTGTVHSILVATALARGGLHGCIRETLVPRLRRSPLW